MKQSEWKMYLNLEVNTFQGPNTKITLHCLIITNTHYIVPLAVNVASASSGECATVSPNQNTLCAIK